MANILDRLVEEAKKKKQQLQNVGTGVVNQVNPFDGGKTYSNPAPSAPAAIRPAPSIQAPSPASRVMSVFNGGREGLSKGFDQVNIFDNGLSAKTRSIDPKQNRSVLGQADKTLLNNAASKSGNTLRAGGAGLVGLANIGKESVFGTDQSYKDAVNRTEAAVNAPLNKGAYLSVKQSKTKGDGFRGLQENIVKPVVSGVADIAPIVAPIGGIGATGSLATRVAKQAGVNAGIGGATNAAQQLVNTGEINGKELAISTALSGAGGAAFPLAGAAARKASPVVTDAAKQQGRVAKELFTGAEVPFENLDDEAIGAISRVRSAQTGGMNNATDADYNLTRTIMDQFDTKDPTVLDDVILQRNAASSRELQLQGGYAKNPFGKEVADGLSKDQSEFINDYANMIEDMGTGNGVDINPMTGTRISNNVRTPEIAGKNMSKADWFDEAREQIESGKAGFGASDEYKRISTILDEQGLPGAPKPVEPTTPAPVQELTPAMKRAENDYATGKIDADQLETMRNAEGSAPAVTDTAPPQTEVGLNTGRLDIDADAKVRLDTDTSEVINKLTNEEVKQIAKSAGMDMKSYDVGRTKTRIAEQLNLRNEIKTTEQAIKDAKARGATPDEIAQLTKQSAELGRASRSQGTDLARQLQARRIIADQLATPEQKLYRLFDEAGIDPDVYTRKLAEINVDPKNVPEYQAAGKRLAELQDQVSSGQITAKQAMPEVNALKKDMQKVINQVSKDTTRVFRELVPAKWTNWLDTVRYNSMLSSPLTQAVNIFGNGQGLSIIAPIEKTVRGTLDAAASAVKPGRERQYAAGEGLAYASGALKGTGKAGDAFIRAMKGETDIVNPDLQDAGVPLAVGGVKGGIYETLSFPMKTLNAFDQMFRTFGSEGERSALKLRESKGIRLRGEKEALVEEESAYRVFQADSHKPGQGVLLDGFDAFADVVMQARNSKHQALALPAKFSVPFVKTINNIAKQGIVEYSPIGAINAATADDKVTALTRAIMGTSVFGTAGLMLANDQVTWGEPKNPDEKAKFRGEGKQPYSMKIGDKWVQFSKLHPAIAFPFALSASIKNAQDEKKLNQGQADAILAGVAKWGEFLSDQSYAKGIGDLLAATKGDTEKIASAAGNYPQQLVPFRALTGWMARMTDDLDRKVNTDKGFIDQQVQSLMLNYPGLRDNLDARKNPLTGEALQANNPVFNNLSPIKVTKDGGYGNTTGLNLEETQRVNARPEGEREALRKEILEAKGKKQQLEREKRTASNAKDRVSKEQQNAPQPGVKPVSVADLKANKDKKQAQLEASLSVEDLELSKLSKDDQKELVNSGAYTQEKIDGLNDYVTSKKKEFGIEKDKPAKSYADDLSEAKKEYSKESSNWSSVKKANKERNIQELEIKKDFDEDTVSLYGLGKERAYELVANDPNGKAMVEKLLAYDDAQVKSGLRSSSKFRDKDGNVAIKPKGKGTKGKKAKYGTFKTATDTLVKSTTRGASAARSAGLARKKK